MYRRHADEVFRYALVVLRSRADAEDVVQTVFMRALRALDRGERVSKPRNWLIKIAHNECRRLLASRREHAELPDELAAEPVEQGRADELRGALEALPAHQKQALVLRELEGRSYPEIAEQLSVSVSAVETLLFRARRAVREQLDRPLACDEFAVLLDDPGADRARLRAHARVCASCAHLERQARGRKSRLGRIASALFPWWGTGAKVAAVALGTATFAGVVSVAGPKPVSGATGTEVAPVIQHAAAAPASDTVPVSTIGKVPARHVVEFRHVSDPEPDPIPPGDEPLPVPEPTHPDPPPVPAPPTHEAAPAPTAAPAPAPAPASAPARAAAPVVTTVATTTSSLPVSTPTAPVPTVTVATPSVTVPPVTTPVATTPEVTVPAVTVPTPTVTLPAPLP